MSKLENPSAFPLFTQWQSDPQPGMTLRDCFAGMYLAGRASEPQKMSGPRPEDVAQAAYMFADAMLAQRAKVV